MLMMDKEPKVNVNSKKPNKSINYSSLLTIMVAVVAGFFGGYFGSKYNPDASQSSTTVQRQIIDGEGNLVNTIANDVSPSVVSIDVTSTALSQNFFSFGQQYLQQSAGTGVIISKDGLIITNRHVVPSGTNSVKVTLNDGTELDADVVGRTNSSDPLDVAFVKIKDLSGKELTPVNIGDSDQVQIGDKVVAIGNALGEFKNTVTSGIISGFGRDIQAYDGGGLESLQNLIQTDAAINSGNSGGPLVNSSSEMIGINVATANAQNISFAIPINDIKPLIETVLETGKLERPYLGIRYISLDENTAKQLGINVTEGAYIPVSSSTSQSILTGSPAEKAGLKEKDIITEINGKKLDKDNTVVSVLGRLRVGSTVDIKILRDDKEQTLQATLEAAPEQ